MDKKEIIKQIDLGYIKVTFGLTGFYDQEPYFSITGEINSNKKFTDQGSISCGCIHEDIAKYCPELEPLIKWHLFSYPSGPMHYVANSLYHASDRDYNGLLRGERRQIKNGKTGELVWELFAFDKEGKEISLYSLGRYKDSNTKPNTDLIFEYRPLYHIGEGKASDLKAARACAVWPDAKLSDFTKENLEARLSGLLESFKEDRKKFGIEFGGVIIWIKN